jgi:hypothetical protein
VSNGSTWLVYAGGIGGGNTNAGIKHVTNGAEADALEVAGWRAFPTEAAAEAFEGESVNQNVSNTAKSAVSDVIGHTDVGELILRVTEILLGIVLIGIGLEKITGAENAVSKIAKNGVPIPV